MVQWSRTMKPPQAFLRLSRSALAKARLLALLLLAMLEASSPALLREAVQAPASFFVAWMRARGVRALATSFSRRIGVQLSQGVCNAFYSIGSKRKRRADSLSSVTG